MIKKIISLLLVFLLLLCFASCDKKIKYYEDYSGNKYEVVLDGNGDITVTDNLLLVYVLSDTGKKVKNENGEYRTEYISFNGQVIDDGYVETQTMKFQLPTGFEGTENSSLLFYNDSYNADIVIRTETEYDIDELNESMEISCNELQESYGSDKFDYEISQFELSKLNTTVYKYKYICTASDHRINDYFYYFIYNDSLYIVEASIANKDDNKVDFDKFVKSISFK